MRGAARVPFTESEPEEETKPISLRLPLSLYAYVNKHGQTRTILQAIRLDRDIGDRTSHIRERIKAYADEEGLSMQHNAGAILARLVEKGLEAAEAERATKKKGR